MLLRAMMFSWGIEGVVCDGEANRRQWITSSTLREKDIYWLKKNIEETSQSLCTLRGDGGFDKDKYAKAQKGRKVQGDQSN